MTKIKDSIPAQLKKGVLDVCVLALLSKGDSYAYEIARELSVAVDMGEGTIYPLMRRLQNDGLVTTYLKESPSGPPRKYYKITDAGQTSFQTQKKEWLQLTQAVSRILGAAP